jgi:hypothetical protein
MPGTHFRRAVRCEMAALQCLLHRAQQMLYKLYSLSVRYINRLYQEFVYATGSSRTNTQLRQNTTGAEAVQVPKFLSVVSNNDHLLNFAAASR